MKLTIDIPREYERDFIADKFKDFFSRVIADINCDGMCGNYEKEIAEMFLEAFEKAIVGDVNLNAYNARNDEENRQKEIVKQKASIEKELKSEIEKMNNIALYEKMAKEHPENPRLAELVNALKELGE